MAVHKKLDIISEVETLQRSEKILAELVAAQPDRHVPGVSGDRGYRVERSIIIDRSPQELFRHWRDFENLPRFMTHIESVTILSPRLSHWVVTAPGGQSVEWDAEIIHEHQDEVIAWRSLEGSDVDSAGSVRFERAPGGRGTIVKVCMKYNPPGGALGAVVAKMLGEDPEQHLVHNLRRFKWLMEAGEIPTTEGQPSGATEEWQS